jgi:pimeloyl-ACP methyl ester carboxylesterase
MEFKIMNAISRESVQSTAEFYERSTGVKLFRATLSVAERIAPQLAVRLAQRLFLTPLPPKWLQRRHAWTPGWLIEAWNFEGASLTVYRRLTAQSDCMASTYDTYKQHVILIHGWGGSAAQMQPIADEVANRGMVPIIIEAPAHGRSKGSTSSLPQFARAIEYVATRLTMNGVSIQGLIAHSLGASSAAFATSRGLPIERLVLIAPPDRPRDFTAMFAQVFGLSEATRARMQRRIEAQEAAHMDAYASHQLGARISTPTLVVHDESDNVNPFSSATNWVTHLLHASLHATQGLGHRKVLREKAVITDIVSFVADDRGNVDSQSAETL